MFERNHEARTSLDILADNLDPLVNKTLLINRHNGLDEIGSRKFIRPISKESVVATIDNYIRSELRTSSHAVTCFSHSRRDQRGVDKNISAPVWLIREPSRAVAVVLDSDDELIVYGYNAQISQFWLNGILEAVKDCVYPDNAGRLYFHEVVGFKPTSSGIESIEKEISLNDVLVPHVDLYPHFKEDPGFDMDMFVEEYLISRESVILNYGPPGTGKTTFSTGIARMALEMEEEGWKVFLFRNSVVLGNPKAFNEVISRVEDKTIFIFEDMDALLVPRASKNGNEFMSSLLNLSAGMDDRNIKFIFNTNQLNLDLVEEALYRPGRCYAKIYSGYLAEQDINPARVAVGKLPVDTSAFAGKRISLAQALSINPRNETGLREFGNVDLDMAFFTNQLIAESRYGIRPDMEVKTEAELPTDDIQNKATALVTETGKLYRFKKKELIWKEIEA